ncbi:hypothetical protein CH296_05590 [Rhodococcus sp. 14-2496-1d]|nr:hypothetical protein CH301_05790 [Rhodococcus sp. 15-1189-1-1a]OZF18674.1 hypothetical protein CH299_06335 [Rhodococcus sp. 14-2686-1-2]OZF36570.1 hypothetical protein CH296_05590 [Rhodococcus sp. 14-2496-1d]OZF42134.1 hypothetical protein CH293_26940 [Rhodococcus sp. 14-2470-1b]
MIGVSNACSAVDPKIADGSTEDRCDALFSPSRTIDGMEGATPGRLRDSIRVGLSWFGRLRASGCRS